METSIIVDTFVPDLENSEQKRNMNDDTLSESKTAAALNTEIARKQVLLSCLLQIFILNTLFLNIETILPIWIPDHFPLFHTMKISYILM